MSETDEFRGISREINEAMNRANDHAAKHYERGRKPERYEYFLGVSLGLRVSREIAVKVENLGRALDTGEQASLFDDLVRRFLQSLGSDEAVRVRSEYVGDFQSGIAAGLIEGMGGQGAENGGNNG